MQVFCPNRTLRLEKVSKKSSWLRLRIKGIGTIEKNCNGKEVWINRLINFLQESTFSKTKGPHFLMGQFRSCSPLLYWNRLISPRSDNVKLFKRKVLINSVISCFDLLIRFLESVVRFEDLNKVHPEIRQRLFLSKVRRIKSKLVKQFPFTRSLVLVGNNSLF